MIHDLQSQVCPIIDRQRCIHAGTYPSNVGWQHDSPAPEGQECEQYGACDSSVDSEHIIIDSKAVIMSCTNSESNLSSLNLF